MRAFVFWAALAGAGVLSAQSSLVISQVYGGGGNSGAPYTHDFVEIFNRSGAPVSLNGLSIQYASAAGTGVFGASATQITPLPNVTLPAGRYFLVQEASGTAGVALPTPDLTDASPIAMSATSGKVALVNSAVSLGCNGVSTVCSPTQLALILDLVGYGTADFFEGTATPGLGNSTAAIRKGGGCTDTNSNFADFTVGAPTPRNTASPLNACGTGPGPISGVGGANPGGVTAGGSTLLTITVTPGTNPASTGITAQADLSAIGGSATQSFFDNGSNGDATPGDNVFSFNATVAGGTAAGGKSLPFSVADAQARTASGSISLTVNAPALVSTISAVQGSGDTSPLKGQTVRVTGIVTGVRGNSFYIQSKTDDGNPATSEGIQVFTGSGNVPTSAVLGNELEVTGVVVEFAAATFPTYTAPPGSATLTELAAPLSYTLFSTGNPLPAPATIDAAVLSATAGTAATRWLQLERFEGMRVTLPGFTVTQNTNAVTIFGTLSTAATPYREAGVMATKFPTGTASTVPVFDANPEAIRVEGNGLNGGAASFDLPFGSTIAQITGILDYSPADGIYSLRTNAAGVGTQTPASLAAAPVAPRLPTDFTVATTNAENFSSSNATKMAKLSLAIRNVLLMPDVVGLQEVSTLASLQALAARIDLDAAASGQTPPNYTATLLQGNSGGAIGANNFQNVGFLYKASRLTGVSAATQGGTQGATYVNPLNGLTELTFDRPPLVLSGVARLATSDSGAPFTIVVNHLKALIDLDNATTDPGDGGLRNQTKRHFGARDTAALLSQLNTGGAHVVSVGDHNAYQFNDGYVDVVNCIRGVPPPSNTMIYQPPGKACETLPAGQQLINLTAADPAARYSYYYLGSRQTLDHILVNQAAQGRVRTYATPKLNADYPVAGALASNPARPERYSDHNPQVAYFTLPNEVTSRAKVVGSGLIYNRALAAFTGTVTVANTGTATLDGPLHVFFHNLPGGVTLANATGTANGVPYITIGATLAPGQSSPAAAVRFATTPATRVTYTNKTYSMTF